MGASFQPVSLFRLVSSSVAVFDRIREETKRREKSLNRELNKKKRGGGGVLLCMYVCVSAREGKDREEAEEEKEKKY